MCVNVNKRLFYSQTTKTPVAISDQDFQAQVINNSLKTDNNFTLNLRDLYLTSLVKKVATTPLYFKNKILFSSLQEDPPTGVSGAPTDNNIMIWNAVIFGPHDTPFEDGTFKLTIEFTEEYPNKPPTVRFVSKMFHPNVYADGGICLDILQNRWSPTYDVSAILTSIQVPSMNISYSSFKKNEK